MPMPASLVAQRSPDCDALEGAPAIGRRQARGATTGADADPVCENGLHRDSRCFRHQLLLPRRYLVLTKSLRLGIQCQRAASVKIGWKYLDG